LQECFFQTFSSRDAAVEPHGWVYACLKKIVAAASLDMHQGKITVRMAGYFSMFSICYQSSQ
jgi:hypothetical protein